MSAPRILKYAAPVAGVALVGGAIYAAQRQHTGTDGVLTVPRRQTTLFTSKAFSAEAPPKAFGGFGFQTLKLRRSEQVNHDTKRLRFDLPDSNAVSGLQPISAVLTRATVAGSWLPTFRPYTPVSDPARDRGYIDLLVKYYPDGKMTPHLHSLQPGDTHNFFKFPLLGGYNWPLKSPTAGEKHLALIAGGAGITPIYQVTRAIFQDAAAAGGATATQASIPKVTLLFGVNTPEDLLFHDEFRALEREYPDHFRCVYTVSHPPSPSIAGLKPDYETGHVNRALMEQHFPKPDVEGGVKVLICGPPAMEVAIAGKDSWFGGSSAGGILGEMGFQKGQVVRL